MLCSVQGLYLSDTQCLELKPEVSAHCVSGFSCMLVIFSAQTSELPQIDLRVFYIDCIIHISVLFLETGDSFSSVQSCLTLCDPMDCSTPGLPVHHQLAEHTQTHAHRVGDAILPSHPLSSLSPPAFKLCQHQALFK